MPSGKEIKSRIKSVKNTGKITKAMELISTVKMKKAQESLFGVRPFATAALKVFSRITRDASTFALYAEAPVADTELIIMVASQKGLCGGYNATVYKKTTEYVRDDYGPGPDTKKYDYITIGKRARDFVLRTGQHLVADFSDEIKDPFTILENRQVVRFIVNEWKSGKYSKISVVYNHYISAITQQAVVRTLFPIVPIDIVDFLESVIGEPRVQPQDEGEYTIEPNVEMIYDYTIPMILDAIVYELLLEARASEHAARMVAMKNAKESANKKTSALTLAYNKARQASITKEVSEIVSGVESMKDM